jgi:hypothetical protein
MTPKRKSGCNPATMNVCAIRRVYDGAFYEQSAEHGTGWTKRIRQAWTYREAGVIVRELFERGWQPLGSVEIVELIPKDPHAG